ncbi:MAG: hypothetical protein HOQ43_05745, partial [Glycomyces artemisiae]|nr:hypothetical protein [Glycomyces artemisiae]
MTRTPEKRRLRRRFGHAAALGALAAGAAVFALPGAAAAYTCDTLGAHPVEYDPDIAFEKAAECGVEVRIEARTGFYSTVYAAPDGRLHLVATAGAVQEDLDYG